MTFYVIVCIAAGFLVGLAHVVPTDHLDAAILTVLLMLVFGVGLDLGARGDSWRRVRALGSRLWAVPVVSAVGSLAGAAFTAGVIWGYPWREACAFGSAFGWYSLSGPVLSHLAGPEVGGVAFLSDVVRELTALVMIPTVARLLGPSEAVALGGATTMDTTLPILAQATDGDATALAFAHGVVLALIVPVLLPLWFSF